MDTTGLQLENEKILIDEIGMMSNFQEVQATLANLVSIAEKSCEIATECVSLMMDPTAEQQEMLQQIEDQAKQAAERASWAETLIGKVQRQESQEMEHVDSITRIIKQAADAAFQASESCKERKDTIEADMPGKKVLKRKMPCRFWVEGICWKGQDCEFSHDTKDLEARPLYQKKAEPCAHFSRGFCARGKACAFCHGDEELSKCKRLVAKMKNEKALERRFVFWREERRRKDEKDLESDEEKEREKQKERDTKRDRDHRETRDHRGDRSYRDRSPRDDRDRVTHGKRGRDQADDRRY